MNSMKAVFLRPETPILFRDGRDFTLAHLGATVDWPMPHPFLGALRTHLGKQLGFSWDFAQANKRVRGLVGSATAPGEAHVVGPFWARRVEGKVEVFLPRPHDLRAYAGKGKDDDGKPVALRREYPLRPWSPDGGPFAVTVDSPRGCEGAAIRPLRALDEAQKGKPTWDVPRFVTAGRFFELLLSAGGDPGDAATKDDVMNPADDTRTHVAFNNATGTGAPGMLFATKTLHAPGRPLDEPPERTATEDAHGSGTTEKKTAPTMADTAEYGFVVGVTGCDVAEDARLLPGAYRLGGKGGLATATPFDWTLNEELKKLATAAIVRSEGRFRVVLLTPGRFAGGWKPKFIGVDGTGTFPDTGVRVRLVSAAVPPPVAHSGWDLQQGSKPNVRHGSGGGPRATRLFVAPGAVYFYEMVEPATDAAVEAVVNAAWFASRFKDENLDETDPDTALDAACGLNTGVVGPWDYLD